MSRLTQRLDELERVSGNQETRIMWCEADWSEAEITARTDKFRRENKIPDSTKIIHYSWLPTQGE